MTVNFMKFEDEDALRQALKQQLKIGSATIDDVLLFCKENKMIFAEPVKLGSAYPEHTKYEVAIFSRTSAPTGAREFFRLSNWKNILRSLFRLWAVFFFFASWGIAFYFNDNILAEIRVRLTYTSF